MKIIIREGRKRDMKYVLNLIKELAIYEQAPREVEVTEKELRRDGFGNKPLFKTLIAESNNKIVGMALFYIKYSTWKGRCIYLEDIIVSEKYRNMGIGSELFERLIEIGKKMKVKRLEWQVLNWNQSAINFYKKYKPAFSKEWVNVKLIYKQLQAYKK